MASDIEIANRAITKLGGERISTFDDGTTESRAVKSMYDIARRDLLRRAVWNFAKKRKTLAAVVVATTDWNYQYQYQLPDDFIRLIQVNDYSEPLGFSLSRTENDAPYQLEGKRIFTNYPAPLKIRYIGDITDPTFFFLIFVEAYACRLAYECCETVTQSNTKKEALARELKMLLIEAMKMNQIENPAEAIHDDSWLLSRY